MRRQHLSVSLSPVPTRINIRGRSEQPLKRDRIYPLHQIEMFRLKYCGDINSGVCAKSSIQIRCFFIGIQWSYRVGAAVRDPEMQPYRSEPRWPSPSINKTGSHVSVCPNLNLHLILSEDQIKSVFRLLKTASRLSALLMGTVVPQCNAQRKLSS